MSLEGFSFGKKDLKDQSRMAVEKEEAVPTIARALDDKESFAHLSKAVESMPLEDRAKMLTVIDSIEGALKKDSTDTLDSVLSGVTATAWGSAILAFLAGTPLAAVAIPTIPTLVWLKSKIDSKDKAETEERIAKLKQMLSSEKGTGEI